MSRLLALAATALAAVLLAAVLLAACSSATAPGSLDGRFRSGTELVNGTRLHYVMGGQGTPVVLLHGFPETWMAWRKVMTTLADDHTVVAVDLRGAGESALETSGYDKETLAADVHQLVERLDLREVSLVGEDFGGQVAYAYARMYRDQVRRLAVVEAGVPGFGLESLFQGSYHYRFHMVPELPERLIRGRERYYVTRFMCGEELDCQKASIDEALVDEYVRAYSRPGRLTAGLELYRALPLDAEANRARAAPKITMPVLALGGERGIGTIPLEQFSQVAEDVTGGVVPGADHWVAEQRPRELMARLAPFLR